MTNSSKYYIQSGDFSYVLLSANLEGAALRFVQLVCQDAVKGQQPITVKLNLIDEAKLELLKSKLGEKVFVSESGFDGEKLGIYQTSEVIDRWQQQIKSVEAMLRKMA